MGNDLPEIRSVATTPALVESSIVDALLTKHSSLNKTCRIVAYCLRLFKSRQTCSGTTFISRQEVSCALNVLCRIVQRQAFPEEYKVLFNAGCLSATSKLLTLSPFLSEDGLLRVSGRLKNSNLNYDACHPILLPHSHVLTKRIIEHEHVRTGHASIQATMAAVHQRFWPLSARGCTKNCQELHNLL